MVVAAPGEDHAAVGRLELGAGPVLGEGVDGQSLDHIQHVVHEPSRRFAGVEAVEVLEETSGLLIRPPREVGEGQGRQLGRLLRDPLASPLPVCVFHRDLGEEHEELVVDGLGELDVRDHDWRTADDPFGGRCVARVPGQREEEGRVALIGEVASQLPRRLLEPEHVRRPAVELRQPPRRPPPLEVLGPIPDRRLFPEGRLAHVPDDLRRKLLGAREEGE